MQNYANFAKIELFIHFGSLNANSLLKQPNTTGKSSLLRPDLKIFMFAQTLPIGKGVGRKVGFFWFFFFRKLVIKVILPSKYIKKIKNLSFLYVINICFDSFPLQCPHFFQSLYCRYRQSLKQGLFEYKTQKIQNNSEHLN